MIRNMSFMAFSVLFVCHFDASVAFAQIVKFPLGNIKDFGRVRIIHNGSVEQVIGNVTQYRIISQTPLDFEPVLQEILTNIPVY